MAVITMEMSAVAAAAAATKGAAPNVDDNDADNEVKARAAQRRKEGRMLGNSDWQDAAVQRNHRVEGFLCVAHIARTHQLHSAGGVHARSQRKKKKRKTVGNQSAILPLHGTLCCREKSQQASPPLSKPFLLHNSCLSKANCSFHCQLYAENICL